MLASLEKAFTPAFESALKNGLENAEQYEELELILLQDGMELDDMVEVLTDHTFEAFKNKGDTYMTRGYPLMQTAFQTRAWSALPCMGGR